MVLNRMLDKIMKVTAGILADWLRRFKVSIII